VLSVDVRSQLAGTGVPVLYLQATRDSVVPGAALADMQRVLPGIHVARIDGPHFLLQARPAPCSKQEVAFVDQRFPVGSSGWIGVTGRTSGEP
jgi:pimeloyl-[acyl-carrier protein] methyl ester esterase